MSIATFLQGVSPFGPIFGKELRTTARRKRTYFIRVVYLALLLIPMVFIAYMATAEMGRYGGVATQNQRRSEIGQIFFGCFAVFSVFMMGLFGPILTATAISSERLHKTLQVLLMTPITAWQIVAGKLFSRLLVALTLIGLGLPVLALVRLLGGVELNQMLLVLGLALVAAISSAAIGLFFSTLLNRAYAVILLSFGSMLFLYLFVPFVMAMTARAMRHTMNMMTVFRLVLAINPYWMVCVVVEPRGFGRLGGSLPWAWCIGSHLVLATFLLFWSALILRRRARREGEGAPVAISYVPTPIPEAAPQSAANISTASAAINLPAPPTLAYALPTVKTGRPAREIPDNPILWRELRRPLMARPWQRITGISIVGVMLVIVYALQAFNNVIGDSDLQGAWACVFNFLIAGIALVISSTAIAQEKESDTWTLMVASPVSGRTIVWGKALGIARRLLWPMVLVAAHFLIFALCGVISFAQAFLVVWIIVTFNTIWIATGVYFSLSFSKVTFAVIANLLLAIAFYLFIWGALGMAKDLQFHPYAPTPRQQMYMVDADEAPMIDPIWLNAGMWALLIAVALWLSFAVYRAIASKRGALGHVMIAILVSIPVVFIFAGKMDWISCRELYRQAGWYNPYYYLAQIGDYSSRSDDPQMWLPNRVGCPVVTMLALLGAMGLGYLLLSFGVLSMTAWKFSGMVGRARQKRKLASADLRDMSQRATVG